jgi:pimeloyl-ACP methyl ester carboxylesterase
MRYGAIFLPGIVTPAEIAFGDLRDTLGHDMPVVLKDLAVYDHDAPPDDYGLEAEVDGVLAAADASGFDRFHLAGYSAGGAIAAAVASRYGDRLASLALMEPAWLGNATMSERERHAFNAAIAAANLPGPEAMAQFVRLNIGEGVDPPPPPPGDPPPWMASRPSAIRAIGDAFRRYELDLDGLRRLTCPVLYVLGGLSNPDLYAEGAVRAKAMFSHFTLELFDDRHHFDPPHRAEPDRTANLLRNFWSSAELSQAPADSATEPKLGQP